MWGACSTYETFAERCAYIALLEPAALTDSCLRRDILQQSHKSCIFIQTDKARYTDIALRKLNCSIHTYVMYNPFDFDDVSLATKDIHKGNVKYIFLNETN